MLLNIVHLYLINRCYRIVHLYNRRIGEIDLIDLRLNYLFCEDCGFIIKTNCNCNHILLKRFQQQTNSMMIQYQAQRSYHTNC